MRLLIVTQKVDKNDDVLGFMHSWISEFAKHYKRVTVICLYKGEYTLPDNVIVLSLGKEVAASRFQYLKKLFTYLLKNHREYDRVFVHMNPIYVLIAGWWWKLNGKKIGLWYTHKNVDLKLRIAEKIVDRIFSASKESFRLPSNKLIVTGHGIDTDFFRPPNHLLRDGDNDHTVLTVGRISRAKELIKLVDAVHVLANVHVPFKVKILGKTITGEDELYIRELKQKIASYDLSDSIEFSGSVPNYQTLQWFHNATVFVNLSKTGSLDKAILEAMATGLPVITSNEAFKPLLAEKLNGFDFVTTDESLVKALKSVITGKRVISDDLCQYIKLNHSLKITIKKIVGVLNS